MSVPHLIHATEWPAYRWTMGALTDAMGRGPAYLGGDNVSLIAMSLLVSLFAALRARLGKEGS